MNYPRRNAPLALQDEGEFETWLTQASREELIGELRTLFLARKENRVDANNDFEAVSAWLTRYENGSSETFRAFKLEAEKLLIWLAREKGFSPRNLPSLNNKDASNYIRFLLAPKSEQEFGVDLLKQFDRKSQPFDPVPLSISAVQRARNALNRMFQGLRELRTHNGTYVEINPWFNIRVKNFANTVAKKEGTTVLVDEPTTADERIILEDEWASLQNQIEAMPKESPADRAHYHRTRWVMNLLYYSFLRRAEAAALLMGDFRQTKGKWWITVRSGKGGKARKVVATQRLMDEMMIYRQAYDLAPHPAPDETLPAILPLRWKSKEGKDAPEPLTPQVIYQTVKQIAGATALALIDAGRPSHNMSKASPHWTRHTGVTHALDRGADARMVQKQAGHASLTTTAIYDHKEKARWAAEIEKLDKR